MERSTSERGARSIVSPNATDSAARSTMQNAEAKIPDTMIGRTLSNYTIQARLGEDGAGVTYQARDNKAAREILVKILHPAVAANAERLERYLRDALAV